MEYRKMVTVHFLYDGLINLLSSLIDLQQSQPLMKPKVKTVPLV